MRLNPLSRRTTEPPHPFSLELVYYLSRQVDGLNEAPGTYKLVNFLFRHTTTHRYVIGNGNALGPILLERYPWLKHPSMARATEPGRRHALGPEAEAAWITTLLAEHGQQLKIAPLTEAERLQLNQNLHVVFPGASVPTSGICTAAAPSSESSTHPHG